MPMKKVCPRCGATFDCMHNDILSCHCATVRLDALQRTYLMENYSDCLCHDCLKAVKDSFYACEINPRYNKKKNSVSVRKFGLAGAFEDRILSLPIF